MTLKHDESGPDGDCSADCPRCRAVREVEERYRHGSTTDLLEHIFKNYVERDAAEHSRNVTDEEIETVIDDEVQEAVKSRGVRHIRKTRAGDMNDKAAIYFTLPPDKPAEPHREALRVAPDGFWVDGRKLPIEDLEAHDQEVYRALKSWCSREGLSPRPVLYCENSGFRTAVALGRDAMALDGEIVLNDESGFELLKIAPNGEVFVHGELVQTELASNKTEARLGCALLIFARHWAQMVEQAKKGEL